MARKPETIIVNQIQAWVEEKGGYVLKLHGSSFQRRGEPDLIGGLIINGDPYPFVCEVKIPGKEPDKLQIYRLEQWRKVGYDAFWVVSLADFILYIEKENWKRILNDRYY